MHARRGTTRSPLVNCGAYVHRVPHPIAAGVWCLFAAILLMQTFDGVARTMGVEAGVFAAPCETGNATARRGGGRGRRGERGGKRVREIEVTPTADLNLTSMFNCEGGHFLVSWSGAVIVTGTIHIGVGTTVNITGNASLNSSSDIESIAGSSTSITGGSGNNSTGLIEVDDLTAMLSIPRGLTSAAVHVASSGLSAATNESIPLGPMFFVDGGQLFLKDMAIRGRILTNSTDNPTKSVAGIHAQNANVSATRCEFEDNFTEFFGGGIFANVSTLIVVDSVFRRCRAGFQSGTGDEDVDGAGGGISSEDTDLVVRGCLFEECYASKKGGGLHHGGGGKMSVLRSVFYNNSAGSNNVEDENEKGEGAALSISTCDLAFDGQAACGVNDTVLAYSHVGRKGGAVAIGSGSSPSRVEFHRCTVTNSTTGMHIEDDPQGEGGAFNVAEGTRLLLSDSLFIDNYSGNKGGVITLSRGDDWEDMAGATVILRNSTFKSNTAELGSGGIVFLGEYSTLVVAGDGNVFEGNSCGDDGGVFAGTIYTNITVEGGVFRDNHAYRSGGVISTKGTLEILGGNFRDNRAKIEGGVIFSIDDSTAVLRGGDFEENSASDGGVVYVAVDSELSVSGGNFSGNEASNRGGAFFVGEQGYLNITGGNFYSNQADFGGFLYKEGEGTGTCEGASIKGSKGVDGGAIYAVEDAVLHWSCLLKDNEAFTGPAIYARDNTTVVLRGVSLVDNVVTRGAVVFVAESNLETYQVEFKDMSDFSDLSAVQVDDSSSYIAEDTSFEGFQGEAVVFSDGKLFLDGCDFSRSTALQLVYAKPNSTVVIRNTVLGDNNYCKLADASSVTGQQPRADSLTNAKVTCRDGRDGGDTSSSDSSDIYSICSEGSVCLEGDVGVYCECYLQRSSLEQRCVNGDASALGLISPDAEGATFFPDELKRDLSLSHTTPAASSTSTGETVASLIETGSNSSSSSSSDGDREGSGAIVLGGSQSGVIWNVSALPQLSACGASMMNWTVFPSSGLLLPGRSITLRVVTLPSSKFDGTASVTFVAGGMGSSIVSSASFDVTFYHCDTGQVWRGTSPSLDSSDADTTESCQLCSAVVGGDVRGVECDEPGATIEALPVKKGHWRAALDVVVIRQCSNEDACKGGTNVTSVQEYCNEGYEGPECAVCASGYGRGAANACHRCTTSFKAVMYSILAVVAVSALFVTALLVVYLVGGRGAVSSTVASTRKSVRSIQRHGSNLLRLSERGGAHVFNTHSGIGSTRSRDITDDGIDMARGMRTRKASDRGNGSSSGISGADAGGSRSVEGVSGRANIVVRMLSAKQSSFVGRAATVKPHSPSTKQTSPSVLTPASLSGSQASTTTTEQKSPEITLDAIGHGEKHDASGSSNRHSGDSSGIHMQHWTSELGVERAYGGARASGVTLEDPTGNTRQSQLSRERAHRQPENAVNSEWSGAHRAQPQSQEGPRAEKRQGHRTAATKIGNILMELPLSKIKIVIVVWQISLAFSNITNVEYPPIYEKFLSIIGVFSLDLSWILSAACLTTAVDFYDKLLMVTIGPLIVLGILGITFHIGAKPARPVGINIPSIPEQSRRSSQADTNVLQTAEPIRSELIVVQGARTSGKSSDGASQVLELPTIRPVLQRGRLSGCSQVSIAMSSSENPISCSCAFGGHHRSAGGGWQSSGIDNPPATSDDAVVNHQESAMGHVHGGARSSASPSYEEKPLGKTPRPAMSVLETGTGIEANPEQDRLGGLFARHTTMTLILLYLVYSQVSTVVFQTFSCEGFPEINKSYLRADQRIECYTRTHMAYTTYAAVMIFLYPLGIPAAFYLLLRRQGLSINPPTDKTVKELRGTKHVVREKIKKRSTDLSIAPTSFLWNAYYPNRYYFEVFECLRRLVLTGLLVFLVPDTPGQVAFSCVFAFVSLLAFELQRPHIDSSEVQLYRTGCVVTFFTNFLALMIKAEVADERSAGSAIYAVVLITVNALFFLSIWWNTWATITAIFSRRGFLAAAKGVDAVREDDVDTDPGPNKKQVRQDASLEKGADANSQPEEEHPAWDDTAIDVEANVDYHTHTR